MLTAIAGVHFSCVARRCLKGVKITLDAEKRTVPGRVRREAFFVLLVTETLETEQ